MSKAKREPVLHTANGSTLNVTWVNTHTEKGRRIIRAHTCAKVDDICKAYKKPSTHKVVAFNDIKKEMETVGGNQMRITGAGCDYFSCAYTVKDGSGFTYIVYHTPCNRFCVQKPE